MVTNLWF